MTNECAHCLRGGEWGADAKQSSAPAALRHQPTNRYSFFMTTGDKNQLHLIGGKEVSSRTKHAATHSLTHAASSISRMYSAKVSSSDRRSGRTARRRYARAARSFARSRPLPPFLPPWRMLVNLCSLSMRSRLKRNVLASGSCDSRDERTEAPSDTHSQIHATRGPQNGHRPLAQFSNWAPHYVEQPVTTLVKDIITKRQD